MIDNRGITILQLVITLIIMMIIMAVSIYYGQNIPKEASIAAVYTEIKEIEDAITQANILDRIWISGDELRLYDEISIPKASKTTYSNEIKNVEGECYFLDCTSSKKLEDALGLEKIKHDYILDYDNLNIYLVGGIEIPSGDESVLKYDSDEISNYYNNTFVK